VDYAVDAAGAAKVRDQTRAWCSGIRPHVCFRRIFLLAARSSEGPLTEPTAGVQPARRELAFMPLRSLGRGSLGFGGLGGWGDAVGGALDRGDVDALHLHHRFEGTPCPGAIGIADQPDKLAGNDLPRHAEPVFHAAALLSLGDR